MQLVVYRHLCVDRHKFAVSLYLYSEHKNIITLLKKLYLNKYL